MSTSSLPEHIEKPNLRPIQPIPVQKDGKQFVALRDPCMISKQTMVVPPNVAQALQFLRGQKTVKEICEFINAPEDQFIKLVQGLDSVGLLWGPTFEKMEEDIKNEIAKQGYFPMHAAGSLGENADACRKAINEYFDQTEDPELEGTARAIVAPHLDYQRGWPNYAAAYYGLRNQPKPDRVVILGTNHFGLGDGVVGTEHGFQSPMGICPPDKGVTEKLVERFGRPLIVDQIDHMPEHSIQLHLPWLQAIWGDVPVVAALLPDPLTEMIEEEGRVTGDQFVEGLRAVLDEVGGTTFFVASSDLSHVGPQFGEPRPVDEQRRTDVEQHDREMMGKFISGDADEFLSAIKWNKNPTRWCSVGNMTALLQLTAPETVELIDYRQAYDDKGQVMVSSAAMVLY